MAKLKVLFRGGLLDGQIRDIEIPRVQFVTPEQHENYATYGVYEEDDSVLYSSSDHVVFKYRE